MTSAKRHKDPGQETYHCPDRHHEITRSWLAGYPVENAPKCGSCGKTMKSGALPMDEPAKKRT